MVEDKTFEYLYNNDPNLQQMWIEQAIGVNEKAQKTIADKIKLRIISEKQVTVQAYTGYEIDYYDLNWREQRPNFKRWLSEAEYELIIQPQNYHLKMKRYSSRNAIWQCAVIWREKQPVVSWLWFDDKSVCQRQAARNQYVGSYNAEWRCWDVKCNTWS